MLSFLQVALQESILYFFYTLLAKQEKSNSPAGARPGLVVKGNTGQI